jgi:hypothetical protein
MHVIATILSALSRTDMALYCGLNLYELSSVCVQFNFKNVNR